MSFHQLQRRIQTHPFLQYQVRDDDRHAPVHATSTVHEHVCSGVQGFVDKYESVADKGTNVVDVVQVAPEVAVVIRGHGPVDFTVFVVHIEQGLHISCRVQHVGYAAVRVEHDVFIKRVHFSPDPYPRPFDIIRRPPFVRFLFDFHSTKGSDGCWIWWVHDSDVALIILRDYTEKDTEREMVRHRHARVQQNFI